MSAVSIQSLMAQRLCDLLPTISPRSPKVPRHCKTCRQLLAKPYVYPLDSIRRALDRTKRGGDA